MAPAMIGLLFLIAASAQPSDRTSPPVAQAISSFRPTSRVTAHATASIRILNAARFGHEIAAGTDGAQRRKARLEDAAGNGRDAELLEFQ